jgi:hypothetical protein
MKLERPYTAAVLLSAWAIVMLITALLTSCSSSPYSTTTYRNGTYSAYYTPPSWAPSISGINNVRYYYMPDCDAYFDAGTQQFTYMSNGSWITTGSTPPACASSDLNSSYVVLLDRNANNPWLNEAYYRSNYPVHSYDQYGNIVITNHLIGDLPSNYTVTARAFDENSNSIVFLESPQYNGSYGTVIREVPMGSIAVYMPPETRSYNFGAGYRSR